MRRALFVLPLMLASLAHSAKPTLEPPPGWRDVARSGKKIRNAVIVLKGPETSSFIVKLAPGAPLDNPAGVRGYLNDVLAGIRDVSKKDYRSSGRIETRVFRNGLASQLLRAQLNGEDRLVLALFSADGIPHLAVLLSAAPEAMMPSLLGALDVGRVVGAIQSKGVVRSQDGQLELALGGGLRSRALIDLESAKGFVLIIQGSGSEILFQKLAEADATKPGEQAAIVKEMTAASAGVPASDVSAVKEAPTAAGPIGVYAWAPAGAGDRMSVGYLPWGYWGYQLFGRGPAADDLLPGVLAALKAGPGAVPGLVASSPRIPIPEEIPSSRKYLIAGTLALVAVALFGWSMSRKNGTLPG